MTETTCTFSAPDTEIVERASKELSYEDRLTMYLTNAATGSQAVICYSMADVVRALFKTQWNGLLQTGSKSSMTWVNFEKLAAWVRESIGDVELADAITSAVDPEACYKDQLDAIQPLFEERVKQYQEVWEASHPQDSEEPQDA